MEEDGRQVGPQVCLESPYPALWRVSLLETCPTGEGTVPKYQGEHWRVTKPLATHPVQG